MKKSQAALEYILIIGLILVAVVVLFTYSTIKSTDSSRINQAYETVQTIQGAAEYVYNIGPGGREYVEIKIPSGVNNFSTKGKEINMNISIYGSQSNIHATSPVIVNGTLPYKEGIYHVLIEMKQDYALIETIGISTTTTIATTTTTTLPGPSFQGCYISNNCGADLQLFKTSYTSNAHAGILTSSYNYYVCCRGSSIGNNCNGKYDQVIKLSSNSNAHVQIPTVNTYPIDICLSTTGSNVVCTNMGTPCVNPSKCMFKISLTSNAHVADCSSSINWFYICCEVT